MIKHLAPLSVLLLLLAGVLVGLVLLSPRQVVQAYPEYAARTGQPCGTCHFNPAGGGPRTPRGELWVISGKPDVVPPLPGEEPEAQATVEIPPELADVPDEALAGGAQLYELFTCGNCHGPQGEGSTDAPALNREILSAELITRTVRTGPDIMPAIPENLLPDDQLEALVLYVQNLATGRAVRVEILDALGPIFNLVPEEPADNGEAQQ